MKVNELLNYLQSLNAGWVDQEKTVDTIKAGDPEAEIQGIAVAWMSYTWALQKAHELGCNVFITHEPTYFSHFDNDPRMFGFQGVCNKKWLIEDNGLVIYRCHDLWDQMPEIGIPDSWGEQLGFGNEIEGEGYFRIYNVSGKTAGQIARQVADRTRQFGQEAVQLIGSSDKSVTRLGIGTGAITPLLTLIDTYKVDIAVCTDDGFTYWREGAFAIDMGIPVIVVNHAVSEEAGLISLARHLQSRFHTIPVHHLPQNCMYQLVSAS
jgi:putative NIF3 family GTP cyclohydrolase 1 type 2